MTTSAVLPMPRSISPIAMEEPMASPSGRACEVTTKRLRLSISCNTCCTWSMFAYSFLDSPQQLVNACAVLFRTFEKKSQFWYVTHAQALQQLAPDIPLGCVYS